MRQMSQKAENRLSIIANVDKLLLYFIVFLAETRETPQTTLGFGNRK